MTLRKDSESIRDKRPQPILISLISDDECEATQDRPVKRRKIARVIEDSEDELARPAPIKDCVANGSGSGSSTLDLTVARNGSESKSAAAKEPEEPPNCPLHVSPTEVSRKNQSSKSVLRCIEQAQRIYPNSVYENLSVSILPTAERIAVNQILATTDTPHTSGEGSDSDDYISIDITDFEIYHPPAKGGVNDVLDRTDKNVYKMTTPLSLHTRRTGCLKLLLSGFLEVPSEDGSPTHRYYVENVPFTKLSIAGYEPDVSSVKNGGDIWAESSICRQGKIVYYRFRQPAPHYQRFWQPTLWIVDLSIHFFSFMTSKNGKVRLEDFKERFYDWIQSTWGSNNTVDVWLRAYGQKDFRHTVISNADFLWDETSALDNKLTEAHLWRELFPNDFEPPVEECTAQDLVITEEQKTVVTPLVYQFFKDTYFAEVLHCVTPARSTINRRRARMEKLNFPLYKISKSTPTTKPPSDIAVGQVVGTSPDEVSKWRDKESIWFAYVRGKRAVKRDKTTTEALDVTWLCHPSHTIMSRTGYPFTNELFFSDICNCDASGDGVLLSSQVTCIINVQFSFDGPPANIPDDGYFCWRKRQIQEHQEATWDEAGAEEKLSGTAAADECVLTLRKDDVYGPCHCAKESNVSYAAGDTALAIVHESLIPVVIKGVGVDKGHYQVQALRVQEKNRVVRTENVHQVHQENIVRRCNIREFKATDTIPPPYNRDGAGDCFYIIQDAAVVQLSPGLSIHDEPKLSGLSLFCGGGNFDRGLEDSGVLGTKRYVDIDAHAMHTCEANNKVTDATFCRKSVDDDLRAILLDLTKNGHTIREGQVDSIIAGSPCPGFSVLNHNPFNTRSLLNSSKTASVMAYVDILRPAYGLMENVVNMAKPVKGQPSILSMLISCLVAMGYQTSHFVLDAQAHGAPQRRSRVFIAFAAPGLSLPAAPPITHSSGNSKLRQRQTSKWNSAIDHPLCARRHPKTVLSCVTAREATADLPRIHDDCAPPPITHPSHTSPVTLKDLHQTMLHTMVPVHPKCSNLAKIAHPESYRERGCCCPQGPDRLGAPQREHLEKFAKARRSDKSNAWGRQDPDGQFYTILTQLHPSDAFIGRGTVHWSEPRCLTLLEARRAQGWPDDEIIVAQSVAGAWKIVGNAVSRHVATALGVSFREAVTRTIKERGKGWMASNTIAAPADELEKTKSKDSEGSSQGLFVGADTPQPAKHGAGEKSTVDEPIGWEPFSDTTTIRGESLSTVTNHTLTATLSATHPTPKPNDEAKPSSSPPSSAQGLFVADALETPRQTMTAKRDPDAADNKPPPPPPPTDEPLGWERISDEDAAAAAAASTVRAESVGIDVNVGDVSVRVAVSVSPGARARARLAVRSTPTRNGEAGEGGCDATPSTIR